MARPLRFILLGDPVSHSRSPAMHTAALAALGLAGTYEARRVDRAGMEEAAGDLRRGLLDGANITMPHKEVAFLLADRVEPEAARAGSVNTWVREEGRLVGTSTDIPGLRAAWARRGLPATGPVLVLGAGGAAAAALVALEGREAAVAARRDGAAEALLARCGVSGRVVSWGEALAGAVVVNCTPLGMRGETLPASVLDEASGLFDMAYGAAVTPAVARCRSRGMAVADGLDLLVAQAEAAFLRWVGVAPPPGVMEAAAGAGRGA